MDILYKVDDAARIIGITASTIKKYYLLIEQHGYHFRRNNAGQVTFTEQDIAMFRRLIQLKNEPGITLAKAVKILLREAASRSMYDMDDIENITDITTGDNEFDSSDITDIMVMTKRINSLEEFLLQQNKLLEAQQYQMNRLIHEHQEDKKIIEETRELIKKDISDRDKNLMETLRGIQEVKQMLAASEQKKSFFFRLFRK